MLITNEKNRLKEAFIVIKNGNAKAMTNETVLLNDFKKYISIYFKNKTESEQFNLNTMEGKIKILSPINILERGFSITRINGKSIKSIKEITIGDVLVTQITDGEIVSEIKK